MLNVLVVFRSNPRSNVNQGLRRSDLATTTVFFELVSMPRLASPCLGEQELQQEPGSSIVITTPAGHRLFSISIAVFDCHESLEEALPIIDMNPHERFYDGPNVCGVSKRDRCLEPDVSIGQIDVHTSDDELKMTVGIRGRANVTLKKDKQLFDDIFVRFRAARC